MRAALVVESLDETLRILREEIHELQFLRRDGPLRPGEAVRYEHLLACERQLITERERELAALERSADPIGRR